jgi:hypothetical protein
MLKKRNIFRSNVKALAFTLLAIAFICAMACLSYRKAADDAWEAKYGETAHGADDGRR